MTADLQFRLEHTFSLKFCSWIPFSFIICIQITLVQQLSVIKLEGLHKFQEYYICYFPRVS